jgi:hypothetical protein
MKLFNFISIILFISCGLRTNPDEGGHEYIEYTVADIQQGVMGGESNKPHFKKPVYSAVSQIRLDAKVILKWISGKWVARVLIGFIWLRIGTGGGLF